MVINIRILFSIFLCDDRYNNNIIYLEINFNITETIINTINIFYMSYNNDIEIFQVYKLKI